LNNQLFVCLVCQVCGVVQAAVAVNKQRTRCLEFLELRTEDW